MTELILYSIVIAAASITWCDFVTAEGQLFHFIRSDDYPEWFAKPLYKCARCFSGWLTFLFSAHTIGVDFNLKSIVAYLMWSSLMALFTMFCVWLLQALQRHI